MLGKWGLVRASRSTSCAALSSQLVVETVPSPRAATRSVPAWAVVLLSGAVIPALALVLIADSGATAFAIAPILAVGMMAAGMVGAAASARFGIGVLLALMTGIGLILLANSLNMAGAAHPFSAAIAIIVAGCSFAARGALFARSAADKGWWIALCVVAGEAAMLGTAAALPASLPPWLLALLPAQWATTAIQSAIFGGGPFASGAPLLALGGTTATTLLVVGLWPRKWPYLVMFTAWLALSAIVLHWPASP